MIISNKLYSCILFFCVQNALGQFQMEPNFDDRFFFLRFEEPAADQETAIDTSVADASKANAGDTPEVRSEHQDPNVAERSNLNESEQNTPAAAGLGFSFPFRIHLSPFNMFGGDSKNASVSDEAAQRSLPNQEATQNDSSVNQRALSAEAQNDSLTRSLSEQGGPSVTNVQSDTKSGPLVERSLTEENKASQNDTAERILPEQAPPSQQSVAEGTPSQAAPPNDSAANADISQRSLPLETNSSISSDTPSEDAVVQRSLPQLTQNITDTGAQQPVQRQMPNENTGNDEFNHPIEEIANRSANLTDSSVAVRSSNSDPANSTLNSQPNPPAVPSN